MKHRKKGLSVVGEGLREREIIDVVRGRLDVMPGLAVGFGDDVSAVNLDEKRVVVLKTDMLVAETDVPCGMSLWQAGRKAVVMNASDFASKGVAPVAALVSLGLPAGLSMGNVEDVAGGLNAGAREYGAYVIGGDTGEASDVVIAVFLYGTAEREKLMLRSGARSGDILAVSGFFGKALAGLRILQENANATGELRDVLVDSVFLPFARLKEGLALADSGAVSASVDSSDGLAWSLHELSRMSGVGFALDSVPVADEVKLFAEANGLDAFDLAFYGGEEYELVVTIKPELWAAAVSAVERAGGKLAPIGKVVRRRQVVVTWGGKRRVVEARGYEHFKSRV